MKPPRPRPINANEGVNASKLISNDLLYVSEADLNENNQ